MESGLCKSVRNVFDSFQSLLEVHRIPIGQVVHVDFMNIVAAFGL